jgi:hypothetical protein
MTSSSNPNLRPFGILDKPEAPPALWMEAGAGQLLSSVLLDQIDTRHTKPVHYPGLLTPLLLIARAIVHICR